MSDDNNLIELTADIVAAHVSSNRIAAAELGELISSIHGALAELGNRAPERPTKAPAVSLRASLRPDQIVCLECGSKHKMLKRHLRTAHALTPEQYRREYHLSPAYPMVAPNYAKQCAEHARKAGLGRLDRPGNAKTNADRSSPAGPRRRRRRPALP